MVKQYIKDRIEDRRRIMEEAKTPVELAYTIWTKEFEEATGSSKDIYRTPFVAWVESYKSKTTPKEWTDYKTPKDLAEAIWQPFLDNNQEDEFWFGSLRSFLIKWINDYSKLKLI